MPYTLTFFYLFRHRPISSLGLWSIIDTIGGQVFLALFLVPFGIAKGGFGWFYLFFLLLSLRVIVR